MPSKRLLSWQSELVSLPKRFLFCPTQKKMRLQINLKSEGRVVLVLLMFAVIWYCSCCCLPHVSWRYSWWTQTVYQSKLPGFALGVAKVHLSLQLQWEVCTSKQWIAWHQMMLSRRSGKFITASLEKLLFTQLFLHRPPAWSHWRKPEQGCVINELWQAFCLSGREVPAISF